MAFANKDPLIQLVSNDIMATDAEKEMVIRAISGTHETYVDPLMNKVVVGFDEAAKLLGYSSKSGVYAALRRGDLKGCYSGNTRRRAKGILVSSIYALMGGVAA